MPDPTGILRKIGVDLIVTNSHFLTFIAPFVTFIAFLAFVAAQVACHFSVTQPSGLPSSLMLTSVHVRNLPVCCLDQCFSNSITLGEVFFIACMVFIAFMALGAISKQCEEMKRGRNTNLYPNGYG